MIHTIDRLSEAQGAVLRTMFEARKRVFVDLLKWQVPVLGGTWELDQFDDQEATYLVLTDERGDHLASARLLKTTGPHILGNLYPSLVNGQVPRDVTVQEITRFCLDRSLRANERREARDQLVLALVDHAIARGISRYTGVAERGWFDKIRHFGWDCAPLGPPRPIGTGSLTAFGIAITQETPALLECGGIRRLLAPATASLFQAQVPEVRA